LNSKRKKALALSGFCLRITPEATIIESYVDSDGAKQRLENHAASPIANEVLEHFDITGAHCFGTMNKDFIEMFNAWGGKFNRYVGGFNHS